MTVDAGWRFQAGRKPVGRPENAPDLKLRAHSDAKPVSTALLQFRASWTAAVVDPVWTIDRGSPRSGDRSALRSG